VDNLTKWKIVNFAIFAIGLGYALVKFAPRFFNARSADIQKAIREATGLKMNADLRYSEIDRKMANLAGEVDKLRAEANAEMEREHERLLREAAEEAERIRKNTAAEIDAWRAEGANQVRRHTAQLAFALAERRLRDRFSAGEPAEMLHDFANLVERGKN
jgi:F-type H+-transporting ATPase subunit b